MVAIFMTEPGSYTVVRAALLVLGATCLVVGSWETSAMARISPVDGFDTMAMPPLALAACTCSARICSVWYCIDRSIVSTMSSPLTAGNQLVLADRDRAALRVLGQGELAGPTGEHAVVLLLETRQPLVVDVDRTEQGAHHRTVGHGDGRLVEEGDTGELERRHLVGQRERHLAGQVAEPVVRHHLLLDGGHVEAEHGREAGRLGRRVGHELGIHEDRLLWHGQGQLVVVAVVDRSAISRQRLGVHGLGRARGEVVARVDDLQVGDLPDDDEEERGQAGEQQQQPLAASRPAVGSGAAGDDDS